MGRGTRPSRGKQERKLNRRFRDCRYLRSRLRRSGHSGFDWDGRCWHGRARDANISAVENRSNGRSHSGIEALPGEIVNDFQRVDGVVRLLIRTVGGQRVEGVGDRNDARQKRDLVSL